ncbi:MAG: mannose-1-phosphate guanylyltransferase [Thermodesulfobacteriota bacterium]
MIQSGIHDCIYAVIMAGGSGTRFWPRSRQNRPKHLLAITGDENLLQKTIGLITPMVPVSRIIVVTTSLQSDSVKSTVPDIPEENIIIEPFGKNTAPAIGISALAIQRYAQDAVMVVLPADHYIEDKKKFHQTIMAGAYQAFEGDCIVTIGITPRRPETGYGYIEADELKDAKNGIYSVTSFHEKPDLETARRFIEQGSFFWNSGIFIAKTSSMLKEIEEYLPHNYQGLMKIQASLGTDKELDVINSVYKEMEAISIDYSVIEKSKRVFMIKGNFGWDDVGSWPSAAQYWPKDSNNNSFIGDLINLDSSRCIVYSPKKPVALLGVKGLVIVEQDDALLVCKKERSQDVKKIVDMLKSKGRDEIL